MSTALEKETTVLDMPLVPPGLHNSCLQEFKEGNMSDVDQSQILSVLTRIVDKLDGTNGTPGVMTRLRVSETAIAEIKEDLKEMQECLKQLGADQTNRDINLVKQRAEDQKTAKSERQNSFWYKALFVAVASGITIAVTTVFNLYFNKTPTAVDKTIVATEQKAQAEDDERLDKIEKAIVNLSNRLTPPERTSSSSRSRRSGTRQAPRAAPEPPGPPGLLLNRLQRDVWADRLMPLYGSARAPNFPSIRMLTKED